MEFVTMLDYLEAQLNQDKTFMDRFLDENMIKSKKFKRACQNRSRWLNWYCQAKDDVLKEYLDSIETKNISKTKVKTSGTKTKKSKVEPKEESKVKTDSLKTKKTKPMNK